MTTAKDGRCQVKCPVSLNIPTAIRHITNGGEDYRSRLSTMVIQGQKLISMFEADIDSL